MIYEKTKMKKLMIGIIKDKIKQLKIKKELITQLTNIQLIDLKSSLIKI